MSELYQQIEQAANFISKKIEAIPDHAIILGTGLGTLLDRIEIIKEISFKVIPYFLPTTVESHVGKLILAKWNGKLILILSGRLHYYEGYTAQEITFPIRVLKFLGVKKLWITNASGTVNPLYQAGEIVFIEDHINFHPQNPLRGLYDHRLGVRFPDMSDVYNKALLEKAKQVCDELKIPFHKGIYFGLQGPSLETPAEYRMIRILGADIVGMSTVPEVIVAHQCEMEIMAVAVVTNSTPESSSFTKTTMESVIEVIHKSSDKLFSVLEKMI
ncbi:MAG: purine-nucleoside phosphorylase [Saprospiraceae bacterium]|nr:purine-nucleoside phosphorylase [Saprospiraceae bacterium]MBK8483531.1 purine-nucleoside phosphorylase [Saprospiraceae bacterium]